LPLVPRLSTSSSLLLIFFIFTLPNSSSILSSLSSSSSFLSSENTCYLQWYAGCMGLSHLDSLGCQEQSPSWLPSKHSLGRQEHLYSLGCQEHLTENVCALLMGLQNIAAALDNIIHLNFQKQIGVSEIFSSPTLASTAHATLYKFWQMFRDCVSCNCTSQTVTACMSITKHNLSGTTHTQITHLSRRIQDVPMPTSSRMHQMQSQI
jgi:hypothetical protein